MRGSKVSIVFKDIFQLSYAISAPKALAIKSMASAKVSNSKKRKRQHSFRESGKLERDKGREFVICVLL